MSTTTVSIIVVVSFLISVLTFVASQVAAGRSGHLSIVDRYKQDIEELQAKVVRLEDRVHVLEEENLHLMRKLLANGTKP